MMCNTKDMVGVPVMTRSGLTLGKVASFDLDAATGRLAQLQVKPRGLGFSSELIIPWTAILEMTTTQVTVADGAVKIGTSVLAQADPLRPTPTLMKEG